MQPYMLRGSLWLLLIACFVWLQTLEAKKSRCNGKCTWKLGFPSNRDVFTKPDACICLCVRCVARDFRLKLLDKFYHTCSKYERILNDVHRLTGPYVVAFFSRKKYSLTCLKKSEWYASNLRCRGQCRGVRLFNLAFGLTRFKSLLILCALKERWKQS